MRTILKGRLKKMSAEALDFTASPLSDRVLAPYDVLGSKAHLKMLAKCGIIREKEKKKLLKALEEIEEEIKEGRFKFKKEWEDVHLNIEGRLIEKVGEIGKVIHTARSRNDQIALDLRLYLRHEVGEVLEFITALEKEIIIKAEQNIKVIMPGFTHLQPAQPVLFSHYLMAHFHSLERDRQRFLDNRKEIDHMPLGAAALAGTSFAIDRRFVAEELGFKELARHSMDAVSDRDFALDFLYASAMAMMHLSRLAEEMIIWSSPAFGLVELGDEVSSTSSIMPQKKNPDVAELIRAKCSFSYGKLFAFLNLMKALPLTYNRDLQEGNRLIIEGSEIVEKSLQMMACLVKGLKINKERMLSSLKEGFMEATELADYLVRQGLPFRKAHEAVASLVRDLVKKNKHLSDLSWEELKRYSPLFFRAALSLLNPEAIVKSKKSEGGTSPGEVRRDVKRAGRILHA